MQEPLEKRDPTRQAGSITNDWPRFTIADILVVMIGAGIGLAGGSWTRSDLFVGIMGLIVLLGLLVVHLYPPQTRWGKRVWAALVTGYIAAVFVALIR